MHFRRRMTAGRVFLLAVVIAQVILPPSLAGGGKLLLKDNTSIDGTIVFFKSIGGGPAAGPEDGQAVVACNDQLRRYYVSKLFVDEFREDMGVLPARIAVEQKYSEAGGVLGSVGAPVNVTPFDAFGRRIFTMLDQRGQQLNVIQGITEITAKYTMLKALPGERQQLVLWDTRIATTSIPRDELAAILEQAVNRNDIRQRMKVVQLYLEMERFEEAEAEVKQIFGQFPQAEADYPDFLSRLQQLRAARIVSEIQLRADAGQHEFKFALLDQFPAKDVAGETLQRVQTMLKEHENTVAKGKEILERLDVLKELLDPDLQEQIKPIVEEINRELSFNTLERMAPFETLAAVEKDKPDESLAMAISGWILGPQTATSNLTVALSIARVRDGVAEYMNAGLKVDRVNILRAMEEEEGATPEFVAPLLKAMKPPLVTPPVANGFHELQVDGTTGKAPYQYFVQLPPEYDPYKKYPTIVTLHAAFTTPQQQIEWWAGAFNDEGRRIGHAMRNGYIVIAPSWAAPHQSTYDYSQNEHMAVLTSLRDACRRFSIDTDHVFLSGHSMGGDAAWDLGLAHPDLWAGVIPISATAGKYVTRYWKNAARLPLYFIAGELDADRKAINAVQHDQYLKNRYATRVCEFLGRGHEHFMDEILNLFDWMKYQRREFFPREFDCNSMRPWDNYFWWIEASGLPEKSMVAPLDYNRKRGVFPAVVKGTINNNNMLNFTSAAAETTIWLTPEMVDFNQPITIRRNGREVRYDREEALPNLEVLLEDARTRADRIHPFWAKVTFSRRPVRAGR